MLANSATSKPNPIFPQAKKQSNSQTRQQRLREIKSHKRPPTTLTTFSGAGRVVSGRFRRGAGAEQAPQAVITGVACES